MYVVCVIVYASWQKGRKNECRKKRRKRDGDANRIAAGASTHHHHTHATKFEYSNVNSSPCFYTQRKKARVFFYFSPKKMHRPFLPSLRRKFTPPPVILLLLYVYVTLSLCMSLSRLISSPLCTDLCLPSILSLLPHPSMPLISLLFLGRNFPRGKINRRCFPNWG